MKKDLVILFDLDGTLIDSTDAIVSTFYHAFKEQNFKFDGNDEDIKKHIGYPLDIMFANLGVDKHKVWDFVDSYKLRYRVISKQQTQLLPNAIEAVELASKYARLGVVTTKTGLYSKELLEHMGIMHYFECLIGRENVENPKPHPEPIYKALEQMDINIEANSNIWMVGDTKLDLISANDAGINSVGVTCGYGNSEELKHYTQNIVNNAYEAVDYIIKC